ncbi:glycosyltransferase family 4 protein [Candidatus Bathyarchaeota archaeon A05DMB-2]|jgi:glycosyltransferase involved in cell wall biosynthesis|nr:glycosyltransferase family 4 protein [Candidatus Bathyarchaeota archaeon A05DMB-2]
MKVVMINDCAYVGETLLKYMPPNVEKQHIKRTRGFWNKTFGLALKILRTHGDVYHAHYLLQDCYIAARLGKKPLIGHAHGSDLRTSLAHTLWGRVVRHNLKSCGKVLVSTPDVLGLAKRYREDAEYMPNPVDAELFYPKPVSQYDGKKRVLIASDCNFNVKGTDIAIKALSRIKDKVEVSIIKNGVDFEKTRTLASSLGLNLNVLPKVTHEKLNEYFWNADVVIDRFKLGSLGMVSLEAIACGRPVITYVSSEFEEYIDFPLKDAVAENAVADAVEAADESLWEKEYQYLLANHRTEAVLERLLEIYGSLER